MLPSCFQDLDSSTTRKRMVSPVCWMVVSLVTMSASWLQWQMPPILLAQSGQRQMLTCPKTLVTSSSPPMNSNDRMLVRFWVGVLLIWRSGRMSSNWLRLISSRAEQHFSLFQVRTTAKGPSGLATQRMAKTYDLVSQMGYVLLRGQHHPLERLLVADEEQQLPHVGAHRDHRHARHLADVHEVQLHRLLVRVPLAPHLLGRVGQQRVLPVLLAPGLELPRGRGGEHDVLAEVGAAGDAAGVRHLDGGGGHVLEVADGEGLVAVLGVRVGEVDVVPLLLVEGVLPVVGQLGQGPLVHRLELVLLHQVLADGHLPPVPQHEVVLPPVRQLAQPSHRPRRVPREQHPPHRLPVVQDEPVPAIALRPLLAVVEVEVTAQLAHHVVVGLAGLVGPSSFVRVTVAFVVVSEAGAVFVAGVVASASSPAVAPSALIVVVTAAVVAASPTVAASSAAASPSSSASSSVVLEVFGRVEESAGVGGEVFAGGSELAGWLLACVHVMNKQCGCAR